MIESLLLDAFMQSLAQAGTEAAAGAATGAATGAVAGDALASALPTPEIGLTEPAFPMAMADNILPQQTAMQAAPMNVGQAVGNFATQSFGQQIKPEMNLYNQITNPNATAGDMARSAFEYSIQSDKDPQNRVTIPAMGNMNPYANMANNTVGGIPSLLQNTQSGLLPFFGSR
jgi:hypothetical protein